ncbi:hypothetical protein PAXRUDRAFT_828787 [Paxillus rubicundulus Ve08.2h10]|uniref:Uncharacterized protein n=1 Tax=Paxillus rubicundulus Ve08.2h10 TaxID=930991 RepID=A0A0D0D9C6_9AGAM|nr:hypothetical protein PAXRUDRAFT_828787 [Paxillus rubicundulus Ve08.2h10]
MTQGPDMQENLASYFQRSVTTVRQYADLIEHNYARPALYHIAWRFQMNPITMTFLSIFCSLSALPLLSFIGLSVFAISSIASLAFISAAIALIIVEAILLACLAFTLWSLSIFAIFVTTFIGFAYLLVRLGVLVSSEGRFGVKEWVYETRQHFSRSKSSEANEGSDGSPVLVDHDGPSSKKVKVEGAADP